MNAAPGKPSNTAKGRAVARARIDLTLVSVLLDAGAVLGRMDDYATRSGYVITPVVVWAGAAREVVPNAAEVASIHRIPTSELLRADAPLVAID